jgi:hypothetical protein
MKWRNKLHDKEHKQIVNILNQADISPAALAYKMIHESRYVNESLIQYMVNYIIMLGTRNPETLPPYLQNARAWANEMYQMLYKMDMVSTNTRSALNHTD